MADATTTTPPTPQDIVTKGVALFSKAEVALSDADDGLIKLHNVFIDAYAAGMLPGSQAVDLSATCLELAGDIATARRKLIGLHAKGTAVAKSNNADIPGDLAELPPRTGIHTDGDGR